MKSDSLEKIASEVIGCPLCKLSRTRKNAVPGEGPLSAKLLFIGEAPGKYEDLRGKPFVGPAGRILDESIKKAGLKRSEVFITNVVKCRPPGNRVPQEDERAACRPYLRRQILVLSPKIICILGSTAYASILGGKSITASRGKIMVRKGQRYFLTVHPAAAIYNRSLRHIFENDILKLSEEFKKIERAGYKDSLLRYMGNG
ncbi:MAG TPA: uracil-DNA glycosylase [Nitrososphaeraceae archaeon]|nr:uracil-DNA glycosylase [Nitrososphaeraceae archaeon]